MTAHSPPTGRGVLCRRVAMSGSMRTLARSRTHEVTRPPSRAPPTMSVGRWALRAKRSAASSAIAVTPATRQPSTVARDWRVVVLTAIAPATMSAMWELGYAEPR